MEPKSTNFRCFKRDMNAEIFTDAQRKKINFNNLISRIIRAIESMACSRLHEEHARLLTWVGMPCWRAPLILPFTHSQSSYSSRFTDLRIDDKRIKTLSLFMMSYHVNSWNQGNFITAKNTVELSSLKVRRTIYTSYRHTVSWWLLLPRYIALMKLWIIAQAVMKNYDNDITSR